MVPALLELAGIVCLTVAGATIDPALAWTVAGFGLLGKAFETEVRAQKAARDGSKGRPGGLTEGP